MTGSTCCNLDPGFVAVFAYPVQLNQIIKPSQKRLAGRPDLQSRTSSLSPILLLSCCLKADAAGSKLACAVHMLRACWLRR